MAHRDFFTGQKISQKPQKNYIQENKKYLQVLSRGKFIKPVSIKSGPLPKFQKELYGIKGSNSDVNCSNSSRNVKQKNEFSSDLTPLPPGFRHQSSQTIADKDMDSLYHEGVIRLPSSRVVSDERNILHKQYRTVSLQTEIQPVYRDCNSPVSSERPIKDFLKMNAQLQVLPKKKDDKERDPIRPPRNYQMGMLPKYLREQKKEQEKIQKDFENSDPNCSPGLTLMTEDERLKQLNQLKDRYAELINELNNLPVKTDTLRTRKKRAEIEKELEKIDQGISLFSKDKIYML